MLVSVASIAVNLAAALTLVKWAGMGHAGLALSTSVVALAGAAALFALLSARIGGLHSGRLAKSAMQIAAASAVMGAAVWASSRAIHAVAGTGRLAQLAVVAASIPLGAAVFYAAARALRVEELEPLLRSLTASSKNAG
jgi:putative peptidoglycan lipid II flippase